METRILTLDPDRFDPSVMEAPAEAIRRGGLVAFPTETVYGIGVNLDHPEAIRRLLEIRESPVEKRITIHVSSRDDVPKFVPGRMPAAAHRLMRRFWPGPLTLVVAVDGGTIGVRLPDHPIAQALIRQAGVRLGAPSANLSGRPPAVDADEVRREFDGKIDYIIDGGPCRHRVASTVVQVAEGRIELLREGAIPGPLIEEANAVTILFVCTGNTCRSPMAERLMKHLLAKRLGVAESELPTAGFRILSAGTGAGHGGAAAAEAEIAVRELGGDLGGHRSQPVSISMAEESDRIFVMTEGHRQVLVEWMPDLAERIALLDPSGRDVGDPIGASLEIYREIARRIRQCLERRLEELNLPSPVGGAP